MDTSLQLTHPEEHLKSSALLTDIVIGMSDGLTVPFALAAGLSGAVANSTIIVIAGIAEICAGSIAMGLGGYLAGKTEQDHYVSEVKREYFINNNPSLHFIILFVNYAFINLHVCFYRVADHSFFYRHFILP